MLAQKIAAEAEQRLEAERRAVREEQERAVERLTDFQIEEFREAFRVFDRDGSGNIEMEELRELLKSVGQVATDEELHKMIDVADADGSGEVDFYEFVALMAHKMADPANTAAVSAAFRLFDKDGNNKIDAQELRYIMMNVGEPVTWEDINSIVASIDQDGSGDIDIAEFSAAVTQEQEKHVTKETVKQIKGRRKRRGKREVKDKRKAVADGTTDAHLHTVATRKPGS